MRIAVLAGGVGAARFLRGLKAALAADPHAWPTQHPAEHAHDITVIGNTGDDIELLGLHVSPDLDTVMYTLGGAVSEDQGWGRANESFAVRHELAAYQAGSDWFTLGDRDLATHIYRTAMLRAGMPLSAVTRRLCERWRPGLSLLPMTDDPVATHVTLRDTGEVIHFQQWWVQLHAEPAAAAITLHGAAAARPAPGVIDAIDSADVVLFPPSNPVVSIGTILAVPAINAAVRAKTVVGVSPIIGDAPVRGMADACLAAIGVQTSAVAVAAHYGPELLDGWLVDLRDKDAVDAPELLGITVRVRPLLMTDLAAAAEIARDALDLALELAR